MFRNEKDAIDFFKKLDPEYKEQNDKIAYILFRACFSPVRHNKYEKYILNRLQNSKYRISTKENDLINIEQILLDFSDNDFMHLHGVGPKRVNKLMIIKDKIKNSFVQSSD